MGLILLARESSNNQASGRGRHVQEEGMAEAEEVEVGSGPLPEV